MKAALLVQNRIQYTEAAFADLVLWQVPKPVKGSAHTYKYRLAYVVNSVCVLRYDNEAGKGDHKHIGAAQRPYAFKSVEQLVADFQRDIVRWNNENRNS
ncbi:MAG: toxin-antitoxin system TumE family protein [Stenotrophobium sp.]